MKRLLCFCCLLLLAACTHAPRTPEGFVQKRVETEHFTFAVWEKEGIQKGQSLSIYLEGDGTPRPSKTVALSLAAADPRSNVIYVSRPCQVHDNKACANPQVWGEKRFHPEIIREMQELIVYLGRKHQAREVELIGYDGGAAVALLLAEKVPLKRVVTVGGILDIDAYAAHHGEKPFPSDNLNPARNSNLIARVAQVHYVSHDDTVTPPRLAQRFVARLKNPRSAVVKTVPHVSHKKWGSARLDFYE